MTYFVSAKSLPESLVRKYSFNFSYFNNFGYFKKNPVRFHFRREIYEWCRKNNIYYKRIEGESPGFLFKNKSDVMAIKLRWL